MDADADEGFGAEKTGEHGDNDAVAVGDADDDGVSRDDDDDDEMPGTGPRAAR